MRSLTVELAERSYPILIGEGLLDEVGKQQAAQLVPYLSGRRVVVVSNETVAPLYLAPLQAGLEAAGITVLPVVLPDGEQYKEWTTLNQIYDALLTHYCDRKTTLIALGGGVVGDITGFAAATYQRGVPFIQIPTTLLSQVDSSVGGKTAINHPLGKNMIGAFYQPKLVLADTRTLATLPQRELLAGLAEVIKYGLIRDAAFFAWLEQHLERLLAREPLALSEAIERSCRNKAEVVMADETEQGERATLNLGHTFGHAIETGLGYGVWLHGEAVAAGTVMAAVLSQRLGLIDAATVARIKAIYQRAGLPVKGAVLAPERYLALMRHDKKVADGKLRLILLAGIGRAIISDAARDEDILAAIQTCCEAD
ncbi:MAG: 3-dehydroquinate synthase [Pseudomonadota bacterium]|jgi:3-dehydroquinate synthase